MFWAASEDERMVRKLLVGVVARVLAGVQLREAGHGGLWLLA
jgi:hypothetical protein